MRVQTQEAISIVENKISNCPICMGKIGSQNDFQCECWNLDNDLQELNFLADYEEKTFEMPELVEEFISASFKVGSNPLPYLRRNVGKDNRLFPAGNYTIWGAFASEIEKNGDEMFSKNTLKYSKIFNNYLVVIEKKK